MNVNFIFLCGGCNDDEELVRCFLFWVLLLFSVVHLC